MTRELASTISQENLRSIDFGLPQHLRTGTGMYVSVQLYSCTCTGTYERTVLVLYVRVLASSTRDLRSIATIHLVLYCTRPFFT